MIVLIRVVVLQAEKLMRQIGVKNVKLSEYEMSIAAHLVDPLSLQVNFLFCQSDDSITLTISTKSEDNIFMSECLCV